MGDGRFGPDWRLTEIGRRLLAEGPRSTSHFDFIVRLCAWLRAEGIPLFRVNQFTPTLHPQMRALGCVWRRDGEHEEQTMPQGEDMWEWRTSPLHAIIVGGENEIRCRLDRRGTREFPIFTELRAEGATEYLAMVVPFSDGTRNAVSWSTDAEGGFSRRHVTALRNIVPPMALVLEMLEGRRLTSTLLDTYLGRGPGREVLNGAICRGDHRRIDAVLMFSDLRGFTAKADAWDADELLDALDTYFQIMVGAVAEAGGEVLKFIGDGLLAIFPIGSGEELAPACRAAHDAAERAIAAMRAANETRLAGRREPLEFVIGLHVGRVAYGNIGGPDRLDFTVIGPAVNLVSRVQAMCKTLGHPMLATADFARHLKGVGASIGQHPVRGLTTPIELFALPLAPATAQARAAALDLPAPGSSILDAAQPQPKPASPP